jgi:hypothetical protein
MRKKSVFIPTQMITFLGNVIDSVSMTVTLPKEKLTTLKMNVYVYKRKIKHQLERYLES